MKKQIISVFMLISLSCQSVYPVFEGVKKRFGGVIAQAKNLINARENIRCLRVGDNCSNEKRALLGTISALVAALVATGIAIAAKRVMGKREEERTEIERKRNIEKMYFYALNNLRALVDFDVIRGMGQRYNIQLNEVRSSNGETLIGAYMNRLQLVKDYNVNHETILQKLLKEGVQPTDADMTVVNGLGVMLYDPQKTNKAIVENIIAMVQAAYEARPASAQ